MNDDNDNFTNNDECFKSLMEDIKEILQDRYNLSQKHKIKDIFHNYYYKELIQKEVLCKYFNFSTAHIKSSPKGNCGADFECKKLDINYGEMKSCILEPNEPLTASTLGKICFDKQNAKTKRKRIYDYDSLVYSLIKRENGECVFTLFTKSMNTLHKFVKKLQKVKLLDMEIREQTDEKMGFDDIKLPAYDLIRYMEDEDMELILYGEKISQAEFLKIFKEGRKEKNILNL